MCIYATFQYLFIGSRTSKFFPFPILFEYNGDEHCGAHISEAWYQAWCIGQEAVQLGHVVDLFLDLENSHRFPQWLNPVCNHSHCEWGLFTSTLTSICCQVFFSILAILPEVRCYLKSYLICISLTVNDVKQYSRSPSAIFISSFKKFLIRYLAYF